MAPLCQACVFDFGNEFCRRDPEPGQRKIMMVNITCVQENIVKDQEKVNEMHPFEISALQGYKSQFIVLKKLRNNAKDQFRKNLL